MSQTKKLNLGKTVKKWLGQGKDIFEITTILQNSGYTYSVQDCIDSYYNYMGWGRVIPERSGKELITAIMNRQKIHVYGSTGVGKTFTIKSIAKELKLDMIVSYARLNEDLVNDWGTTPFEDDNKLFVLEGDAFYWRAYGVVKDYIKRSKSPIVIITVGQSTPTKNITKLVKQFKIFPPTREEMLQYILQFDPNWEGDIDKIYDKDQRITWRNYLYNKTERTEKSEENIDAKNIAYKILKGTATYEDFEKSVHPWYFVLNWISYNAKNFYDGDTLHEVLETLAWIDTYKFNYKERYLIQLLLELPTADKKGMMIFPPYKLNKEEDKKETKKETYTIEKYKTNKKKSKPKNKTTQKTILEKFDLDDEEVDDDLGDFMLL